MFSRVISTTLPALVVTAALCAPVRVAAQPVPADLTATVLVRALGYDRGIAGESGSMRIAVVGDGRRAEALSTALAGLAEEVRLAGRPIEVLRLGAMDPDRALEELRSARVEVLLFAGGSAVHRRSLLRSFVDRGGVALCDTMEPGCMMAVEREGSRPRIVVDLRVVRRADRQIDARLLRLADVRR